MLTTSATYTLYIYTYIYMCVCARVCVSVVNFDALAQATNFKSKGDTLSSTAECRNGKSLTPIHQQTECPFTNPLSYQGSNLNSAARPYYEWAVIPLHFTADWLSHLALAINIVNSDALAQAIGFRIERRQVVFLCWMQDSKLGIMLHSQLLRHSSYQYFLEK